MYRLIEKGLLPSNPSLDQVAEYLRVETGGAVQLDEGGIEESPDPRYWRVHVYSTEAGAPGPATIVENRGQLSDEEIERQINFYGKQ